MNREDLICTDDARVASIEPEPGEASHWHYHSRVTETVFGLVGEVRQEAGATGVAITLLPGQRHEVPPGVAHRLSNSGNTKTACLLVQNSQNDFIAADPSSPSDA